MLWRTADCGERWRSPARPARRAMKLERPSCGTGQVQRLVRHHSQTFNTPSSSSLDRFSSYLYTVRPTGLGLPGLRSLLQSNVERYKSAACGDGFTITSRADQHVGCIWLLGDTYFSLANFANAASTSIRLALIALSSQLSKLTNAVLPISIPSNLLWNAILAPICSSTTFLKISIFS